MFFRRAVLVVTAVCFLGLGLETNASAGAIGTQEYLSAGQRSGQIARIQAALSGEQVQARLIAMGVDPSDAANRVASLNDQELATVADRLDQLPAGGDGILVVIGVVFVVLLILEITGVIDIFKRV